MFKSLLKKLLALSIAFIVIGALGYGALWASLAYGVRELSTDWVEAQRKAGWAISMQEPRLNGFPGWPEVVIEDVSVTAPIENGGWTWSVPTLTTYPSAPDLTRFMIRAPGEHSLTSPLFPNAPWVLTSNDARLYLDMDSEGQLQRSAVEFEDMEVLDPNELPFLGADYLTFSLRLQDIPREDVSMVFQGFSRDTRLAINIPPFARTIKTAQVEMDLIGDIQPGRLQDAVEAWRANSGTLEVRRILLDWPPLSIDGDGTLALDENLQPIAAFSTRLSGFGEALGAMADQGLIDRSQMTAALTVLNLLSSTPRNGTAAEITLPVSVQDQILSVGPFDLMTLPHLTWE